MKPQPRLCVTCITHNFFFSLSILLSQSIKQSKLRFPVYETPFSLMSTFACYANRKSYITLNYRRAFQIWRITDIDKKVSFSNVKIIPLSLLRYFMLRPLVLVTCGTIQKNKIPGPTYKGMTQNQNPWLLHTEKGIQKNLPENFIRYRATRWCRGRKWCRSREAFGLWKDNTPTRLIKE